MPDWVDKYRAEGMDEAQIQNLIKEKQHKYVEKWGNKSRVGILLNSYNQNIQEKQLQVRTPKRFGNSVNSHEKMSANLNERQRMRLSSLPTIGRTSSAAPDGKNYRNKGFALTQKAKQLKKTLDRRGSDYASVEPVETGHFVTTNQSFHETLDVPDYSAYKRNFKKKTPFTQWSNAYFAGGVFFNPPVNGI